MGTKQDQYDSAEQEIASLATKAEGEEEAVDTITKAIEVCEREGVPRERRIDVIIEGYRLHLEQEMEVALQKMEKALRRFKGL